MLRTTIVLLALASTPALAGPTPERAVYRLDFALTTSESGKLTTKTLFALTLPEQRQGEAMLGDNIALPTGTTTSRQNVGLKVKASYETHGADILLDVETELTERSGTTTLHRMATRSAALAAPGKSSVIVSIDHDKTHTELTVTPTRL